MHGQSLRHNHLMIRRVLEISAVAAGVFGMTAVMLLAAIPGPARAQQEARVAAVIDGDQVITYMDLVNRARLVMFATGLQATQENMRRLMPQILDGLINETLELQEAKAQNITVREKEIQATFADMEQRNKLPAGGLDDFLASKGLTKSTLESQVRANIAWAKLVDRRLRPQVKIGDEEVDEALQRLEENRGKPQLLVSEIFLPVDDTAGDARVKQSATRIAQQIRAGASFTALARALSQSTTAASGGDLGWLTEGQLDDEIARILATMQPGQMAGPIRTSDGYHIILLRDRRLPGGSTASQVTVDLRQIGLPLPASASEDDVRTALAAADRIRAGIDNCEALDRSLDGGAKVARIGRIRVSDLAASLQPTIMQLDSDQISAPLRTKQGIVLFMVCDREAEVAELPDRNQIRKQLEVQRLDLLARRYLRDLRRAAFVDIRL